MPTFCTFWALRFGVRHSSFSIGDTSPNRESFKRYLSISIPADSSINDRQTFKLQSTLYHIYQSLHIHLHLHYPILHNTTPHNVLRNTNNRPYADLNRLNLLLYLHRRLAAYDALLIQQHHALLHTRTVRTVPRDCLDRGTRAGPGEE